MAIKIIITEEFYDTNRIPDALTLIAGLVEKGFTKGYTPSWRLEETEE